MAEWPVYPDKEVTGRVGVNLVSLKIHKELGWIFREKSIADLGIDGEIEIRNNDNTSHGRLISVQIKCGGSYLREKTSSGHVYRGDYKHLRYWSNYTTPVIIVICDDKTNECWWQVFDLKLVAFHDRGWSLEVPFENTLSKNNEAKLQRIADGLQKKDLIEILFKDWIVRSFEYEMKLASVYEEPRDFKWFPFLGRTSSFYVMFDYTTSALDRFDNVDIEKIKDAAIYNHGLFGYDRLIVGFVSETIGCLASLPHPPVIPGVRADFVPLLLNAGSDPLLVELSKDGSQIDFYDEGKAFSGLRLVERYFSAPESEDRELTDTPKPPEDD